MWGINDEKKVNYSPKEDYSWLSSKKQPPVLISEGGLPNPCWKVGSIDNFSGVAGLYQYNGEQIHLNERGEIVEAV